MKTRMIVLTAVAGALLTLSQGRVLAQPTITMQPKDFCVSLNASAQFKCVGQGSGGLVTYRWWFKDAALDPEANPSVTKINLVLSNVTEVMAGDYWAVLTDDTGSVTSRVARLTVSPTFYKVTGQSIVDDREPTELGLWCDYSGDGYLDLFAANSLNASPDARNSLYRNQHNGTFARITNALTARFNDTLGSAWGDYDNDGRPDLLVTHQGGLVAELFYNQGGNEFRLVPAPFLLPYPQNVDAAWGDLDGDGWLDLVLTTWDNERDQAFRNRGDGTFAPLSINEVGALVGDAASTGSPSFADFDNDGDADLYVSSESGRAFLYRNSGNGRFEKAQLGSLPAANPTVGGVWADVNNDGFFDLLTTARTGAPTLHLSVSGQEFADATTPAGLTMASDAVWGPAFGDVDNDGDLDLFVPYYSTTNRMFLNEGDGTFVPVDPGSPVRDGLNDECAAWVDYDNDGFLDLFVACGEASPTPNLLYRNNLRAAGNTNHWLEVKLKGVASNAMAIGAKVRVRATINGRPIWQLRQIASNGGFASGTETVAHFGLGDATVVEVVRVEWPSGNLQEYRDQPVDQIRMITEPTRIQPPRPTASLGGSVTLANVSGTGTYQWRFNGVDLTGKTNRTLGLTNIQTSHQGRYSVVVTASSGTLTTNFASLLVDTQFTKITTGPVVNDAAGSGIGLWADYDNDGFIDLMVTRSPGANSLFRNNRDGTFAGMTPADAGTLVADVGGCTGAAWGDLDNDGQDEFFAARGGVSSGLYRRGADGRFERVADAGAIVTDSSYKQGSSLGDYDNDGYLDAFVATAGGGTGWHNNSLYHNDGDGTFSKVLSGAVATTYFEHTESGLWGDADGDGSLDLLVLNYQSLALFANEGHGTFTRVSQGTLPRDLGNYAAWGDYDNDGRLDLFVGCWQTSSRLWHNEGSGAFTRTLLVGGGEGFSGSWGDYDNDGCLDLFVPRGEGNGESDLLYRNNGDGSFTQVGIGSLVSEPGHSEAASWGDYDNDGFLDLFVGNTSGENDFLYHNNGNTNHWLMFRLIGTVSNRSAVGAKVRVGASIRGKQVWQVRELSGGPLGNDRRVHFGLGNATKANVVRIEWPSGIVQELTSVKANQIVTVTEPPRLESLGQGRLRILCWARQNYEIEVSDDLDTWTSLGVVAHDLNRPEVIDRGAADRPYRFYRAVQR